MATKSKKKNTIGRKRKSHLGLYLLSAVVAASALATGHYFATRGIDKAEAYFARRRMR